jgi:hypothetical protein
MKNKFIILIGVLVVLLFGALFLVARITFQGTPTQPTTETPVIEVPSDLTAADTTQINEVTDVFVEALGTYSQSPDYSTNFSNFGGAMAYATERLRIEMQAFIDAAPDIDFSESFEKTATVTGVTISRERSATGVDQVFANVTGETTDTRDGTTTSAAITGRLSMVRIGGVWFVDDLEFLPPLAGFK